jgi:CheY-like chemotaxis protein
MATTSKRRLDEILVEEGLISQVQIDDALMRQKMHGGKFGSQLLYHRYIDEASLVKALSIQFGCEGVILSEIDIPDPVARMIPSKLALTRMVIPFEYDPKTLTIKIACENPTDQSLVNELNFNAQGKRLKLYVAAELVLETVINKHFLGRDAELNDKLLIEIPDNLTAAAIQDEDTRKVSPADNNVSSSKAILFVTDEEYASSLLEAVLSREGYEVSVVGSIEAAAREITGRSYYSVFIRESLEGDRNTLVETIRRGSPRTIIQVYKTAGSLVLHDEAFAVAEEILTKNLGLFTSILSSKDDLPHNHSAMVGRYTEILCRRLGLSARDRMHVVMAGYLHDLARYYYPGQDTSSEDYKAIIESSKKLLGSFEYSGPIIGMLSAMYRNLQSSDRPSTSLDLLGGNIVTIVDLFCENIVFDRDFTLDKFDAIKKRMRDFSGKLFFAEVVEAFIGMIQEEILNLQTAGAGGRIQFYSSDTRLTYPLLLRFKNEGFRVASCDNIDGLIGSRDTADAFVFHLMTDHEKIAGLINELSEKGFDFKSTPTVLIVENSAISKLGWLYERGVEDVMSEDLSIDLMILKLRRLLARTAQRTSDSPEENYIGARGRLADMNLIDLMQALGPGRRTVKIIVTPANKSDEKLTIFLDKGAIAFAQVGENAGAEAVYKGMTWADGSWTVEPVNSENLPASNNALSNDAILMEGAYRLDEKMRAGRI